MYSIAVKIYFEAELQSLLKELQDKSTLLKMKKAPKMSAKIFAEYLTKRNTLFLVIVSILVNRPTKLLTAISMCMSRVFPYSFS